MLKLLLIWVIINSYHKALAANDNLTIFADKLIMDQANRSAEYEGNARIIFQEHILFTHKVKIYFKEGPNSNRMLDKIVLPTRIRLVKNDLSEIYIADEANYNASTETIIATGKVIFENKGKIVNTKKLKLYIGPLGTSTNNISF